MGSNMPLVIVVAILAVTSVTALVAAFVRERRTFSGYEDIREDIMALKARLSAEIFRDGHDLVISGTDKKIPVVVRFSFAENTPGLNIRVHGPSTLNLAVVPRSAKFNLPDNLRASVNTSDDMFNSRFLTKADDSAAAQMFLMGRATVKELQKALCSSRTTLNITHGALELSETTIPQYAGNHTAGHIDSLLQMSAVLARMPGAQLAVVEMPKLPPRFLMRTAMVFGAAAALLTIIGAAKQLREPAATPTVTKPAHQLSVEERSEGVVAVDAKIINDLENYRVVKPAEMDSNVVAWIKAHGAEPAGRVPLNLGKKDQNTSETPDVAYLLTDPDGNRRLVILYGGKVVFDARNYGPISIVRIPNSDIAALENSHDVPEGDGLLVIADPAAPDKSYLLYLSGNSIKNRPEPNWDQISLH
jgi:hypothetical protein